MATALGNDHIISGPAPAGIISSARKMAPRKAAKLRIGAVSHKTWVVARAGMPAATHLTMDNDDEDVDVATAIERGLAMATGLGNNRIIGGPAPTGKTASARKMAPVEAAKLRLGAASDKTQVVARAGLPTATHLTMDDDNEDVDVATAIKRGLARRTALGNDRKWPCHGNGAWQRPHHWRPGACRHDFVRQEDGAREGCQATHWGSVRHNSGGHEGRIAHSDAPHDGQ